VIRNLSVLMDSKLTFGEYVDVTVSKARQMLGFIMRVGRDFRDAYALKVSEKISSKKSRIFKKLLKYAKEVENLTKYSYIKSCT
jgi:hypothetical protein